MNKAQVSSSGNRKYTAIWQRLKNSPHRCEVRTNHKDSATVINGVKKEKAKDKNKLPHKRLDISSEEIPATVAGAPSTILIVFKLVDEVSINTI